jgi:hypothetical protein
MKKRLNTRIFIVAIIFVCFSAFVVAIPVALFTDIKKIDFSADYYYVYYSTMQDEISASSLSSTVQSYGGAGYIVESDKNYYITIACYYEEDDANSVCTTLSQSGIKCDVLKVSTKDIKLTSAYAKNNANKYSGVLNTLDSLSKLCYDIGNNMDKGEYNQEKAKGALSGVSSALNGLLRENSDNCFTQSLKYISSECEDVCFGYIYSGEVRKLQIAIVDSIVNCNIY